MAWRSVNMSIASLVAPLLASLLTSLVATPVTSLPPTGEPVIFEAAFQGRCGEGSPCEQLCRELHDGTFECGCSPGYVLHEDGYGCQELNATTKATDASTNLEEDVLYQKDVSFSAELEGAPSSRHNSTAQTNSNPQRHIDEELKTNKIVMTTKLPADISKFNDYAILPYNGEKFKQIDGVQSLISDGVSRDDIDMIADDDIEKFSNEVYAPDENNEFKVTTLGPSLEQKVPEMTTSPPWTAAVESCHCGSCEGARCVCTHSTAKCTRDLKIITPRFSGSSWLAIHALRGAYKRVRLRIRVRPERARGVLLLTGEHDDLSGDYLALILHQGHVELRFDCGSGAGILRSPEPVKLGRWNTISVYRHRWDAWLKLNDGTKVRGRSKGLFSRMTFREPVWVGGAGNTTGLLNKLGLAEGLLGCVDFLRINGDTYQLTRDAVATADIDECAPTLAPWKPEISPTAERAPYRANYVDTHAMYGINDIVHFEDNDIVMRDARTAKKSATFNDIDNSIEQFKVSVGDPDKLADDVKIEELNEVADDASRCMCEHGGGCVGGVCLCPLGYAGLRCEITLDLKVPRFNGSSYLRLPGLGNTALSWLNIEVTLKPTSGTGLVLYNADHVSGDGDFFSLHLRGYFVEFAYDLGSGIALVRSAYPLVPNTWHHVSISRSGRRATLRVQPAGDNTATDEHVTRSVVSHGVARKLSLRQPLLLGGAPKPLPQRLALTESYSGCVSQLVINEEEISVVSAALGGVNVDNCDESGRHTCRNEECLTKETMPEYQTHNRSENSIHHAIVAKKGFKLKHHKGKSKKFMKHSFIAKYEQRTHGSTKKSKHLQHDTLRRNAETTAVPAYRGQNKHLKVNEINWSDTNAYPSFTGKDSFIHMDDEETIKRLLSYTLDINIRFRCLQSNGLLVWSGRAQPKPGDDFLSLGIENSVLVFRYDLGSGEVVIIANRTKIDDGLWHRARATRNKQAGVLEVDGLGSVGKFSPGKLKQLNTENGLYIGGLPSIEMNSIGKYTSGLVGCVSQISLSGDFDIPLSLSKLPHTITNNVGRCTP